MGGREGSCKAAFKSRLQLLPLPLLLLRLLNRLVKSALLIKLAMSNRFVDFVESQFRRSREAGQSFEELINAFLPIRMSQERKKKRERGMGNFASFFFSS